MMPNNINITPNSGKKVPTIGNGELAVILAAIIVQNKPKTTAIMEPIKDMPEGPRPGFMLFKSNTPVSEI